MSKRKCPIENCCNTYCRQSQKEIIECQRRNKIIGIFDTNYQNQKAIECLKEVKEYISKKIFYIVIEEDISGKEINQFIDNKIKELEGNSDTTR